MRPLLALPACLLLVACAGSPSSTDTGSSPTSDATRSVPGEPAVSLVDSGFGQAGEYVQGIAIVTSQEEAAVGEFVTVSMNFLDSSGAILATEEQVEQLWWAGQQLVLPVWLDLSNQPKASVARVDASLSLSDHGSSEGSRPPLTTLQSKAIEKAQYGSGHAATFEITNETDAALEDIRVGVVCYDANDNIIGGASEYPSLVAPGKTIRLDVSVTTSGEPANCKAFPNYGD